MENTTEISSESYKIEKNWFISRILIKLWHSILGGIFFYYFVATRVLWFRSSVLNNHMFDNSIPTIGQQYGLTNYQTLHISLLITPVLFIILIITHIIWRKNYKFALMPEYIYITSGIVKYEKKIPYNLLKNIIIKTQNPIDKFFDIYSITNTIGDIPNQNNPLARRSIILWPSKIERISMIRLLGLSKENAQEVAKKINEMVAKSPNLENNSEITEASKGSNINLNYVVLFVVIIFIIALVIGS